MPGLQMASLPSTVTSRASMQSLPSLCISKMTCNENQRVSTCGIHSELHSMLSSVNLEFILGELSGM